MLETLVILLALVAGLAFVDWRRDVRRRRRVSLKLSAIHYHPKPNPVPMTNLRSPVSQFAQIVLDPSAEGQRIKLDADAIVVEVSPPEAVTDGARATVTAVDDGDNRRFVVNLIPGNTPTTGLPAVFTVRGDAQPGEGVEILEEVFEYITTPDKATSLNPSVSYQNKSTLPPA